MTYCFLLYTLRNQFSRTFLSRTLNVSGLNQFTDMLVSSFIQRIQEANVSSVRSFLDNVQQLFSCRETIVSSWLNWIKISLVQRLTSQHVIGDALRLQSPWHPVVPSSKDSSVIFIYTCISTHSAKIYRQLSTANYEQDAQETANFAPVTSSYRTLPNSVVSRPTSVVTWRTSRNILSYLTVTHSLCYVKNDVNHKTVTSEEDRVTATGNMCRTNDNSDDLEWPSRSFICR